MLVDYDSDAPAVVGGEMAPAPQDNGGEEMGAVYEPVHGETATYVGTVVQIPFLLPSVLLIYSASSITTGIQVATTVVSLAKNVWNQIFRFAIQLAEKAWLCDQMQVKSCCADDCKSVRGARPEPAVHR